MPTELDDWFVREVLPLEAALARFLRRHRQPADDVADLLQEVYVRIYESAARRRPELVQAFVFTTARNLLIDQARRAQIVSIEAYADLETLDISSDDLTPERHASGHQELRLLQNALEQLPLRCGEVVRLRKIDGMSQREVAQHMGIAEDTVEKQIAKGMRALADALLLKGVVVNMSKLAAKIRNKQEQKGGDA
ncbi:RNA polymerase sigma factor [Duganella callida]|uniref:Sigma-70 family RNA polymerase sigma factor n=1 Tax=Duganella callida TaxID=2561932 RepID=A0A4Y9T1T5_9BURK|nr:sigma-70 family RNA polymerase sigma factor [Duganella callida]TFW31480.1 sigma-70 family RNA polymerase sigma factor [Duganella callida]